MPITRVGFVDRELELHKQFDIEHFRSLFIATITRKVDHMATQQHALYREARVKQIITLQTNAFIKINPPYQLLERYGIEGPQEILVLWSNPLNTKLGVEPRIGDKVKAIGIAFELLTYKPEDYWGNTQYPMHYISIAKRLIEA